MRTITTKEVDRVSGGVGAAGAAVGFAVGASTAYAKGGSFHQIAAAGILGGLSGLAGNLAGSAAAGGMIVRGAWGLRSFGLGFASGMVPTGGSRLHLAPNMADH